MTPDPDPNDPEFDPEAALADLKAAEPESEMEPFRDIEQHTPFPTSNPDENFLSEIMNYFSKFLRKSELFGKLTCFWSDLAKSKDFPHSSQTCFLVSWLCLTLT